MLRPAREGVPHFGFVLVALVHGDDPRETAADVIQDALYDVQIDADARHAARAGAAQVVQAPQRHIRAQRGIEALLDLGERTEWRLAVQSEDETVWCDSRAFSEDGQRER